jgi:YhcN/YlaJ family sporulation lipoprotein
MKNRCFIHPKKSFHSLRIGVEANLNAHYPRTLKWKRRLAALLLAATAAVSSACGTYTETEGIKPEVNMNSAGEPTSPDGMDGVIHSRDNNTSILLGQTMAEAVTGFEEVHAAEVLVLGTDAFVSVILEPGNVFKGQSLPMSGSGINDSLQEKVARYIAVMNADIRSIYLSANPDFRERLRAVDRRLRLGQPTADLSRDLYKNAERISPWRFQGGNNPIPPVP